MHKFDDSISFAKIKKQNNGKAPKANTRKLDRAKLREAKRYSGE